MFKKQKVQCDYKQKLVLVDYYDPKINDICMPVMVYVFANKRNIKQYCRDTGLSFSDGLKVLKT